MSATLRERYDRLYVKIDLYQPISLTLSLGAINKLLSMKLLI